jgi:hypothetical protein
MLDQDKRNLPGRKVNGTKIETTFEMSWLSVVHPMSDGGKHVLALCINPVLWEGL